MKQLKKPHMQNEAHITSFHWKSIVLTAVTTKVSTLVVKHFIGEFLTSAESSQQLLVRQNFPWIIFVQIWLGGFSKLSKFIN